MDKEQAITLINGLAMALTGTHAADPETGYTFIKLGLANAREAYTALAPELDETTRMMVSQAIDDAHKVKSLLAKLLQETEERPEPDFGAVAIPVRSGPSCGVRLAIG